MKFIIIFFTFFVFVTCNNHSGPGTLGGGKKYEFNCSRDQLQKCMIHVKENISRIQIPDNLKIRENDWENAGYDFLKGIVYFLPADNNNSAFLIYTSLIKSEITDDNSTKPSRIAIRAIYDIDKVEWKYLREMKENQVLEIEKRFENEIISEIKKVSSCSSFP